MNKKNGVEVIINGKRVNLSGYESEEYLPEEQEDVDCLIEDWEYEFTDEDVVEALNELISEKE